MIKQQDVLNYIDQLPKDSPEFFQVYTKIHDRYWDIRNPDEFQEKAILLQHLANRQTDWEMMTIGIVAEQLLNLVYQKGGQASLNFLIEDLTVYVHMYTDPKDIDLMSEKIAAIYENLLNQAKKPGQGVH